MSDTLVFNTEEAVKDDIKLPDPFPLYDETYTMLDDEIPEYLGPLPNPDMLTLVARLKVTMKLYGGLGLSANQCGVYERVFVIGYGDQSFACINPKIVNHSEELVRDKEGCLSYPGMYLTVPRYKWVEVEFLDEMGKLVQTRFEGITARCFQHELDHMNGIKYTKYVGAAAMMMARKKQKKMIKTLQRNLKKR